MRDRKWDFIPFSFYDTTGMVRHLEKRAEQGWLVERMTNLGWHYRRIKPRRLRFTVTYYLRASAFDPEPTEGERTFHDFCAQTGWKLAASSGQMQVFYNEDPDPVPIHTEPALELAQMGRMARRALPLQIFLLILGLWWGAAWVWSLFYSPIDLLSSVYSLATGPIWLMLALWCGADLICYLTWRRRAKKAALLGEFVPTRGCHKLLLAALAVTGLGLAYILLADRRPGFRLVLLAMLALYVLLFLAVNGTRDFLKRKKAPRALNRGVTLTVDVVLAFALMAAVTVGLFWGLRAGVFSARPAADDPPLALEDLMGTADDRYVTDAQEDATVFLSRREYRQHIDWELARPGEGVPSLDYTVVDVHLPLLYERCVEELLRDRDDWTAETEDGEEVRLYAYVAADPAPWGAERAWRRWRAVEDTPTGDWLLCWPGRIVVLEPGFELTQAQMALAGEKLAP